MAVVDRDAVEALIHRQETTEIFEEAEQQSAVMANFRRVDMGTSQKRMPVIDALPKAKFVGEVEHPHGSDEAKKSVTRQTWTSRMMNVEEIACISVVPEAVLDDAEVNVWSNIRPRITEAFGIRIDEAIVFGDEKPISWPDSLVDKIQAAGNYEQKGSGTDVAEDINQTQGLVFNDGFNVNGQWAPRRLQTELRGLRDNNNNPIFVENLYGDQGRPSVYGIPIQWVTNGSWDSDQAEMIVGDMSKALLGLRRDISFKVLDQATIDMDGDGENLLHLAQSDSIALRATMRIAYQTAEHPTRDGGEDAFPFAMLQPEAEEE